MSYKRKDEGAPCRYLGWNEVTGKEQMFFPTVTCDHDCEHCGWNPDEQVRRMRTGKRIAWNGVTKIIFRRRKIYVNSK